MSRMGGLRGEDGRKGGSGGRGGIERVVASLLWCIDGIFIGRMVMF